MAKMVRDGCNFVVHTMSEHDVAYHPRNMIDIVKVSRELGLEVFLDPWGVGRVFGGESFSTFVKLFPDSRQRLNFVEGEMKVNKACLNAQSFRDKMLQWIELAAQTGADGVFWDEPHLYYGELSDLFGKEKIVWGCSCLTCKDLFRDTYGYEMPVDFSEDVKEFRQETIVKFIEFLSNSSAKQGLRNSVCVLPMPEPKYGLYQWDKIAKMENIDIFGSDPYWICYEKEVEDFVGRISKEVVRLCEMYHKEAQIWIQGFRVSEGREPEVATAIRKAFDSGVRNMASWCFDAGACMSYISSDRPEIVWDTISKNYRELQLRSKRESAPH